MSATDTIEQRVLTTAETCAVLKISRKTLNRWVDRGLLAPIRLTARTNRFYVRDVDRLLAERSATSADAAVIRGALELLAEQHAEDQRPLCPSCVKRRVNRSGSLCTWCEQNAEAQLLHKRNWWERKGSAQRSERRAAAADV